MSLPVLLLASDTTDVTALAAELAAGPDEHVAGPWVVGR
jgi:hypothetical protein